MCLYPVYVLCTILLKLSSATIYDLCILCANVYNLIFGILLFNNKVSTIHFIATYVSSYTTYNIPMSLFIRCFIGFMHIVIVTIGKQRVDMYYKNDPNE